MIIDDFPIIWKELIIELGKVTEPVTVNFLKKQTTLATLLGKKQKTAIERSIEMADIKFKPAAEDRAYSRDLSKYNAIINKL